MPQADGTVLIDTEINADGMEAGTKEVEAAARRMASSVENIGTKAKTALNKQVDAFVKLNQEYAAQSQKVDELRQKVEAYGNQKIPTDEYAEIQNQISQAEQQMTKLINAQERFVATGGSENSSAYKRRQYDIEELANTIKYAEAELKDLEASGKAFTDGMSTKEAVADMQKLEAAERRLSDLNNRLGTSYSAIKNQVNDYNESIVKTTSDQNKFNKSLNDTDKSAKKGNLSMGRMLATSILFSFVFQAISAVTTGVREGFENLAQYSESTNRSLSMLMSSLTRLKNSFATAFSPILNVVAPILSQFIDMISAAATAVGQLMAALTGQNTFTRAIAVQEDYAQSLQETGKAASDAGKDAKKALAPFDDLVQIQRQDMTSSGSGGGSSGEISPSQMFETIPIESRFLEMAARIKKVLSEMFRPLIDAWEIYGPSIRNSLKLILNDFVSFGAQIGNLTIEWFKNLNWEPLLSSVDKFLIKLEPLINLILGGLAWGYENVLLPFGKWTIEEALPGIIDIFSGALSILNSVLTAIRPGLEWLWDNFLSPIAEWTGGIIVTVLNGIGDALDDIGKWIGENQETVENIAIAIGSFVAAWGTVTLVTHIYSIIAALVSFIASGGLAAAIATALGAAITFMSSPITIAILAIGALITVIISLYKNWDKVTKSIITALDVFFPQWRAAWERVKTTISEVWSGIVGIITGCINSILSGVENMVNGVINAINWLIRQINKISIDVPATPFTDAVTIGFNIPELDNIKLPRLASGTVIPPNVGEFAAILGDNKRETEIVSPVSAIKEALLEALQESGSVSEQNITIRFEGSMSSLARALKPELDRETARRGTNLVIVGGR